MLHHLSFFISTLAVLSAIATLSSASPAHAPSPRALAKPSSTLVPRAIDCSHNGGTPLCCQATLAGDLPIIVTLAGLTGVPLNPNDVNCIGPSPASAACVGVNVCCQVVPATGLVALYCQKPNGS